MTKTLRIKVTAKDGDPVTRTYTNPMEFEGWKYYEAVASDGGRREKIRSAWKKVLPKDLGELLTEDFVEEILWNDGNIAKNLETDQLNVDWHLDFIVHEYLRPLDEGKSVNVKTNAFRDCHATEIIQDDKTRLLCPPFFERVLPEGNIAGADATAIRKFKRGFQDTHIFLAKHLNSIFELPEEKQPVSLIRIFSWFEVSLRLTIATKTDEFMELDVDPDDWHFDEADHGLTWDRASEFCITHKIWKFPGFKGILLSSPVIRAFVEKLSLAWHNINLHKLLIIAPPGSGKEKLKELFLAARQVSKSGAYDLIATDLASDPHAIESAVFALQPEIESSNNDSRWNRPCLFVDEIHQATPSVRASLLRILENDVLESKKPPAEVELKQLVWLFAASKTRDHLLGLDPSDFWTRMDEIIEMRHPLEFADPEAGYGDTRQRVLADYFWLYWKFGDKEQGEARNKILSDLLSNEAFVIAKKFAESVGSPLVPLFSIRYIRGMAKRIRSQAILFGLQERPYEPAKFLEKISIEKIGKWTIEAFADMVQAQRRGDP